MWEHGCHLAASPIVIDERLLNLDTLGDEQDRACLNELCMQAEVFL